MRKALLNNGRRGLSHGANRHDNAAPNLGRERALVRIVLQAAHW